jgi:hypothetical protein
MAQKLVNPSNPLTRPEWVDKLNTEGRIWAGAAMLREMVPLDADSLIASARNLTGLDDFGEDDWREPFAVLLKSLEDERDIVVAAHKAEADRPARPSPRNPR